MDSATFVTQIRRRVQAHPEQIACIHLEDGRTETASLTYAQLDCASRAVAAQLQERGVRGQRALLMLPSNLDFVVGFIGCLYAGAIAVPAFPFRQRWRHRLNRILEDSQPSIVLTSAAGNSVPPQDGPFRSLLRNRLYLAVNNTDYAAADDWRDPVVESSTVALLQYTSGSTDSPKGVVLTHGNLMANAAAIQEACGLDRRSDFVGWLPLFHDMGLMGTLLQPLYLGSRSVLMPTAAFMSHPSRWLQAVSRYRAHTSGGPDFGYRHCLRHVRPEECEGLDLSHWRVAFNGSEPVQSSTLESFAERFAPFGFRRSTLYPTYGLAEATLFVTGGRAGEGPVMEKDTENSVRVGSGRTWRDCRVAVVDPATGVRLSEKETGEIWVSGRQVSSGYWNDSVRTEEVFGGEIPGEIGRYFRTGDLGFLTGGELFVTGRMKDLLVIRGRNIYPQDVESTAVASVPDGRGFRCAAVISRTDGEEQLTILLEVDRHMQRQVLDSCARAVRQRVVEQHGVEAHAIALLRVGSLPVTSSGKIRRLEAAMRFAAGLLAPLLIWRAEAGESLAPRREGLANILGAPEDRRQAMLEEWLRGLLATMLKVAQTDVDFGVALDSLGLDSLGIVRVQHTIERELGITMPLALLFEGGTVRQVAQAISGHLARAAPLILRQQEPLLEELVTPATLGQKSIWYLYKLDPQGTGLHLVFRMSFPAGHPSDRVRSAVRGVWERHASLRARFRMQEGELVQVLQPRAELPLDELHADDQLLDSVMAQASRPFDLVVEPPFRAILMHTPDGRLTLLVVTHHIAVDFWSLSIMAKDLEEASRTGVGPGFGAAGTRPADAPSGALQYWREKLLPLPAPLTLPMDRGGATQGFRRGAVEFFELSQELRVSLDRLAKREACTLFSLLLAAFQLLLHDLSGQEDLLVGTPTNGRTRSDQANEVGYFVNPVVIRSQLTGDPAFSDFLKQIGRDIRAALQYQNYPFARLTQELKVPWSAARHPLFDVVFLFHQAPGTGHDPFAALALERDDVEAQLGACTFSRVRAGEPAALYDLEIAIAQMNGRLSGTCKYPAGSISSVTCRLWLRRFESLLKAISLKPGSRVSQLLSRPRQQTEQRRCLHQLFEQHASLNPIAPGVSHDGTTWTYATLNERANEIAHQLLSAPGGAPARVAVLLAPGPLQVAAILAVLKAGSAFVGLNPDHPPNRLAQILDEVRPDRLIADGDSVARMPSECARSVEILLVSGEHNGTHRNPCQTVNPRSIAYIAYTSGSTGRPKGILQTHENLVQFLEWQSDQFSIGPGQRVAQLAAITFDVSYCEIFGALCFGAAVCIPASTDLCETRFCEWLARERVTIAQMVPSIFRRITADGKRLSECPQLEAVIFVGEGVAVSLAKRLLKRFPNLPRFYSIYGPTETVAATCYRIAKVSDDRESVPIGRPINGRTIFILDERGNPCPPGTKGEIHIVSPFLSPGYFQQAEETSKRFVALDSFGTMAYKTGDLGLWLSDGNIQFGGRVDNQVKIHGVRIEIEEVETAIRNCKGVWDCGVTVRETADKDRQLIAFLEAANGLDFTLLLNQLQTRLPRGMMPARFATVAALPRNAHGKIDRRKLADLPIETFVTAGSADDRDWSPDEKEVLGFWREMLQVDIIGRHDPFFALGGHSLLAVGMINRVQSHFGLQVPMAAFLAEPTITGCARLIQEARTKEASAVAEIEQIIAAVEAMPDEAVEQLLLGKPRGVNS